MSQRFIASRKSNQSKLVNKLLTVATAIFLLASCANKPTGYQLDPEVNLGALPATQSKVIALAVELNPNHQPAASNTDQTVFKPQQQALEQLRKRIIEGFVSKGYKITSSQSLADYGFRFYIDELDVHVNNTFYKDVIEANSKITVTLRQNDGTWSKSYTRGRNQEVALKANEAEISGIVNLVVGDLMANIFNDQELLAQLQQ